MASHKILVIDDQPDNLITLKALLNEYLPDYRILTTTSGREGIALAAENDPDTILLDIQMPGLDGYQVCQRLKAGITTGRIPIIFLTAVRTSSGSRIKALEMGGDVFLTKPITPGELVAQVKTMLRVKSAEDRLREEKRQLETRYNSLFENANDAIFVHDLSGHILEVNKMACSMLGYTKPELLTRTMRELHPQDILNDIIEKSEAVRKTGSARFETTLRHRTGRLVHVEVSSSLVEDNPDLVQGLIRDITPRKMAESKLNETILDLNRRRQELRALHQAGQAVLRQDEFSAIAGQILKIAGELIGSTTGYVALLSPEGDTAEVFFREAGSQDAGKQRLTEVNGRVPKTALEVLDQAAYRNHLTPEDQRLFLLPRGFSPANILSVPLMVESRVVGVMVLIDKAAGFNGKDTELAESFAEMTSIALQSSRLIEQISTANSRLQALWEVSSLETLDPKTIAEQTIQAVVEITASRFGFIARLAEDGSTLTIQAWNGQAQTDCSMPDKSKQIQIRKAGLWAEPLRTGEPLIWNDYWLDHPAKKGLPHDHLPLHRLLVIPRSENGRTTSLVAVANRETPYSPEDLSRIGSFMDSIQAIIDSRRAAEALRESENLFRTILESSPFAVLIVDSENRFEFCNRRFVELTGYPLDEIPDRQAFREQAYPDPTYRRSTAEMWSRWKAGGSSGVLILEREITCRDGSVKTILFYIVTLPDGRDHVSLIDMTEQRTLEAQLRQTQKMEAIGTLAGGIAHDFNNILAAITGYTELAIDEMEDNQEVLDNLERALQASGRAKELIRQILAFSRKDSEAKQVIQAGPIVKEAVRFLRAGLPATIELEVRAEPNLDPILADPVQLHQIVMNLCTNAAHAIGEENGRIEVGLKGVEFKREIQLTQALLNAGRYLCLTVRDNGSGMDRGTRERIFEPFFTTKRKSSGTGMGLAVIHGIAIAAGGAINVSSQPGVGTTFRVYLPTTEEQASTAPRDSRRIIKGTERLLFVDDEEMICVMAEQMLKKQGYEVETFTSSPAALEELRTHPAKYDAIITDQTMPVLTGDRLAAEVREIRPDIPMILCTGFSGRMTPDRARELGFEAFLPKPVAARDMSAALRKVLQKK